MIQIDKPMPEGCDVCPLMYDYIQCNALPEDCEDDDDFNNDEFDWTKRPDWCPLKDQEPVEPELEGGRSTWWHVCGECHGAIDASDRYCKHCGRRIKHEKKE